MLDHRPLKILAAPLLVSILLFGCASRTPDIPVDNQSVADKQLEDTPLAQAQALEKQGNFSQASDLYERTARMLPFPRSEVWRAKAAELAWRGGQLGRAEQLLKELDTDALNRIDKAHVNILRARIARQKQNYPGVIEGLNIPRATLPHNMQRQMLALLYQAYNRTGNREGLAQVLIERLSISRSVHDSSQLWKLLSEFSPEQLKDWRRKPISQVTRGWIDLSLLAKTSGYDTEKLESALLRWEQSYRNHPAKPERVEAIRAQRSNLAISTQRIAVLLPMSGPYGEISRVILDGLMAAQLTNPGNTTNVQVYDTGSDPAAILNNYQRAVLEGANLVIGPMNKSSVDQLAMSNLTVPVIAMNYGKNQQQFNPNLFQFALLPEDEAAQAAERMAREGMMRTVVFVPDNDWGKRVADAFTAQYEAFGGTVVSTGRFNPSKTDNSPIIRQALGVKKDERREDVDAIFMAATPKEGRLLKPLFRFHHAGDLPVFATSHVFSGQTNVNSDIDLNGVSFVEIPWLVGDLPEQGAPPPQISELSQNAQQIPRLFAFGYDAFTLAPKVRQLAASPLLRHEGLSGDVYADSSNRLHRVMRWAKFSRGRPQPLSNEPGY